MRETVVGPPLSTSTQPDEKARAGSGRGIVV